MGVVVGLLGAVTPAKGAGVIVWGGYWPLFRAVGASSEWEGCCCIY